MYIYANPNPVGKVTDDCTVRTMSIILSMPWEQAYMELCSKGLMLYDMPNRDVTLFSYLRGKGFKKHTLPDICPSCYSIKDFCKEYPKGEFVVLTANHAVPVIDGNYLDAVDSGNEIVSYYWEKEK